MAATCGEVAAEIAGLPRGGEAGVGLWTSKPLRAGVPGEGGSCVAYVITFHNHYTGTGLSSSSLV